MSKALAASSLQNIFFPAYKGHTFHRINLEYVVPLQALGRQRVYGLLDAGFRSNLRKLAGAEDALQSLRPQLETQVSLVSMQGLRLLSGREDLRKQLLTTSQGSFSLYRAGVEVDFASQKLSESLLTQGDSAQQRVLLAEHMLKDALRVNERNLFASASRAGFCPQCGSQRDVAGYAGSAGEAHPKLCPHALEAEPDGLFALA
jgi:hypothetical protein